MQADPNPKETLIELRELQLTLIDSATQSLVNMRKSMDDTDLAFACLSQAMDDVEQLYALEGDHVIK